MSSRPLLESETGLQATVIGFDGLALVINDRHAIPALNSDQVRGIYSGRITRWSQLGADVGPIVCIGRADGRAEVSEFLEYFHLRQADLVPARLTEDNPEALAAVIQNPDAMVYMSLGLAEYERSRGKPIRLLAIDGVPASTDNIFNGSYPIIRPLLLLTRPDGPEWAREFVRFAQSETAKECLRQQHLLPNGM